MGTLEALDPRFNGPDTAPLLGDFCSKPLPDIRPAPPAGNMVRYQLVQGQVGKLAAVSCIIGLKGRSLVRRTKAENYTCGEHGARLYTPAELLIHDLYVHRDLRYAMSPELAVYSHMPGGLMYPGCGPDQGLLPIGYPVISLGSQPPDVLTPEFPRYSKMIHYVFERSAGICTISPVPRQVATRQSRLWPFCVTRCQSPVLRPDRNHSPPTTG